MSFVHTPEAGDPDSPEARSWAVIGPGPTNGITDVAGVHVGQYERKDAPYLTGATVLLFPNGAVGGVDVRGGAPGTRHTDALAPWCLVEHVHGLVLAGGSAYGLEVASGVVQFLEERGTGLVVGDGDKEVVPIVPAAILFDLGRGGNFRARPDAAFGYRAAESASSAAVEQGTVGAGTGAVAGGLKGGIGTASVEFGNGTRVGAIVAVNARGSTVNPRTGRLLGGELALPGEFPGLRQPEPAEVEQAARTPMAAPRIGLHTTIAVVATSALLTKVEVGRMAAIAHDGLARAIRPVHTMFDGDTVFGLSTGAHALPMGADEVERSRGRAIRAEETNEIFVAASDVLTRAVAHAMVEAQSVGDFIAYRDRFPSAFRGSSERRGNGGQ